MQIIPTIGLSIGYDDNITQSNMFEQESFFYIIAPAIRVELPSDHSVLALTAGIEVCLEICSEPIRTLHHSITPTNPTILR